MADDPRRQLFHDLRGVIAAANANVEFVREQGVAEELLPVIGEISHELRLVADVISQLGQRDPDRVVELDLRALLWLSARSGARMRIDPTAPPFAVRGRASVIGSLVDALGRAVAPGAHATLEVTAGACGVHGLDRGEALDEVLALATQLRLAPRFERDVLLLSCSD